MQTFNQFNKFQISTTKIPQNNQPSYQSINQSSRIPTRAPTVSMEELSFGAAPPAFTMNASGIHTPQSQSEGCGNPRITRISRTSISQTYTQSFSSSKHSPPPIL